VARVVVENGKLPRASQRFSGLGSFYPTT